MGTLEAEHFCSALLSGDVEYPKILVSKCIKKKVLGGRPLALKGASLATPHFFTSNSLIFKCGVKRLSSKEAMSNGIIA